MWHRGAASFCLPVLITVASCNSPSETTLDRIRTDGFVRAAYAHEPPYAFVDDRGAVVGESPAALRGALPPLSIDSVRWVRMDFDELLPGLADGRVDVIASGLFVTPERSSRAAFTHATSCSRPALLVRDNGPSPSDLAAFTNAAAGRVAVVRGTVEEEAVQMLGVPEDRVLRVPDVQTGIVVVREGRVDALALTEPTLRHALGSAPDLRVYAYNPSSLIAELVQGCSALVVRQADGDLVAALNEGLRAFVGSPEHLTKLEGFGFSADALPDRMHRGAP